MTSAIRFAKAAVIVVAFLAVSPIHGEEAPKPASVQTSQWTHVVTKEIPTLSEISYYLYGSVRMVPKLAQWNHIQNPDFILAGQVLRLERAPTLTPEQGMAKLQAMWKRQGRNPTYASAQREEVETAPVDSVDSLPALSEDETTPAAPSRKIASVSAPVVIAPPPPTESEQLVDQGKVLLKSQNYPKALAQFKTAEQKDPTDLGTWFFEFRTLHQLGHKEQLGKRVSYFLVKHPEFQGVPALDFYLKEAGAAGSK